MRSESKITVTDATRMVPDCLQIKDCAISMASAAEDSPTAMILALADPEGQRMKKSTDRIAGNALVDASITVLSGDDAGNAGSQVVGFEEPVTESSSNGGVGGNGDGPFEPSATEAANADHVRQLLARFFDSASNMRTRKRPKYAIRPATYLDPATSRPKLGRGGMCRDVMVAVFRHLPKSDLLACMLVSRDWNRWCLDPRLWLHIDASHTREITEDHLGGIVRRQSPSLDLSWSTVTDAQLRWLCERLPCLERLYLAGLSWPVVSALRHYMCPPRLKQLVLSYVNGLGDQEVRCLLSGPMDGRPGLISGEPRLKNLTCLSLRGARIFDSTLAAIGSSLQQLESLDLSDCYLLSDEGVVGLVDSGNVKQTVSCLSLNGCGKITDKSLSCFETCLQLKLLDLGHNPGVTEGSLQAFVLNTHSKRKFSLLDGKILKFVPI